MYFKTLNVNNRKSKVRISFITRIAINPKYTIYANIKQI